MKCVGARIKYRSERASEWVRKGDRWASEPTVLLQDQQEFTALGSNTDYLIAVSFCISGVTENCVCGLSFILLIMGIFRVSSHTKLFLQHSTVAFK